MFTTIAYTASADQAALTLLPAAADQHVRVISNDILVPRGYNKLIGYYALGVSLTGFQIVSPSIRREYPMDIAPFDIAVTPPLTLPAYIDRADDAVELKDTEQLNVLTSENGAGATRMSAFLFLADASITTEDNRETFAIKATATTTLTAFAWTNGALTFSQNLPAGRYACVGAKGQSAGLLAFRFVPIGYTLRPGALGCTALNGIDHPRFRRGGLGTWFEFDHDSPPTIEFFSSSADTAETVILDLVQIS